MAKQATLIEIARRAGVSIGTDTNGNGTVDNSEMISEGYSNIYAKGKQGNKLILWTCRAGDALDLAIHWCRQQDLEFDAINDNLPETIEKYGHNSRKITCDYYIDDRALMPEALCS